jgi:hypothetical protein
VCAAREAYKAIAASQREGAAEEGGGPEVRDYTEYYRPEVLEAGIRAGKLIPGLLRVNKHLSQQEAFVTPRTATDARLGFSLIFLGGRGKGGAKQFPWHGKHVRILITAARSSQDFSASSAKKLGRWRKNLAANRSVKLSLKRT